MLSLQRACGTERRAFPVNTKTPLYTSALSCSEVWNEYWFHATGKFFRTKYLPNDTGFSVHLEGKSYFTRKTGLVTFLQAHSSGLHDTPRVVALQWLAATRSWSPCPLLDVKQAFPQRKKKILVFIGRRKIFLRDSWLIEKKYKISVAIAVCHTNFALSVFCPATVRSDSFQLSH